MIKLTLSQVRSRLNKLKDGESIKIGLLPCKANPNSVWISPTWLEFSDYESLKQCANEYAYYNCNSQLGYRVSYWIEC